MRQIIGIVLAGIILLMIIPGLSETDSIEWEGIPWLLRIYGYEIDQSIVNEMHQGFHPLMLNCGDVQIEVREILYDGAWMYTSATAVPSNTEEIILLPSSAAYDDYIAGGYFENLRDDTRTFLEAAQEDKKDLLYIEAYPIEYDEAEFSFTDHRQDAGDQSTLFSGAPLVLDESVSCIHFSVQISRISSTTGEEMSSETYEYPIKISRLESQKRTYLASGENLPFNSIMLMQTPLATHTFPEWNSDEMMKTIKYKLMNLEGERYPRGLPEDGCTYRLEGFPSLLNIRFEENKQESDDFLFELVEE